MKKALAIAAATAAVVAISSCAPDPRPFEFTFYGETSGAGFVMVDRLSVDRTKGIVVHAPLLSPLTIETKNLKRLREEGKMNVDFQLGAPESAITVQVYEFTNAVSGFTWHHGNYHDEVARQWDAESGSMGLALQRPTDPEAYITASVTLSNVVFRTDGKQIKRRIEHLTIRDVPVGGHRL